MASSVLANGSDNDETLSLDMDLTADTTELESKLETLSEKEIKIDGPIQIDLGGNDTSTGNKLVAPNLVQDVVKPPTVTPVQTQTVTPASVILDTAFANAFSTAIGKEFKKVEKELNRGNLLGGFSKALMAPTKAALSAITAPIGVLSAGINGVVRGGLESVGKDLLSGFSPALLTSIFEPLSNVFGDGGQIGSVLGSVLGGGAEKFAKDFYKTTTEAFDFIEKLNSEGADYSKISSSIQSFFQVQGTGLSEELRLYNELITVLFSEENVKKQIKPKIPKAANAVRSARAGISKTQTAIVENFAPEDVQEIKAARIAQQKQAKSSRKKQATPERLEEIASEYRQLQKEADQVLNATSRFSDVENALSDSLEEAKQVFQVYTEALTKLKESGSKADIKEVTELRRSEILPKLEERASKSEALVTKKQEAVDSAKRNIDVGDQTYNDRGKPDSTRLAGARLAREAEQELPKLETDLDSESLQLAKSRAAIKKVQTTQLTKAEAEEFITQKKELAKSAYLSAQKALAEQQELVKQLQANRQSNNRRLALLAEERKLLQGKGDERRYLSIQKEVATEKLTTATTRRNELVESPTLEGDELTTALKKAEAEVEIFTLEVAALTDKMSALNELPEGIKKQISIIEDSLGVTFSQKPELIDSTARLGQLGANASVSQTGRSISLTSDLINKASSDSLDENDIEVLREELIHFLQVSGQLGKSFKLSAKELEALTPELQQYASVVSDADFKLEAEAKALRNRVSISEQNKATASSVTASQYNEALNPALREKAKPLGGGTYNTVDALLTKSEQGYREATSIAVANKAGVVTSPDRLAHAAEMMAQAIKDQKLAYAFIKDQSPPRDKTNTPKTSSDTNASLAILSHEAERGATKLEQFTDAVVTATRHIATVVNSPQVKAVGSVAVGAVKKVGSAVYSVGELGEKAGFSLVPGAAMVRKPLKAVMRATVLPGLVMGGISAVNPPVGGALAVGSHAISAGLAPLTDLVVGHLSHLVGGVVDHALPGMVKTGALSGVGNTIKLGVVDSFEMAAKTTAMVLRNSAAKGVELGGIGFAAKAALSSVYTQGRKAVTKAMGKVHKPTEAAMLRQEGIVEVKAETVSDPWDGDDLHSLRDDVSRVVRKSKDKITDEIGKALDNGALGDAIVAGVSTIASVSTAAHGPVAQAMAEITTMMIARSATNAAAIFAEQKSIKAKLPKLANMLGTDLGDKLTGDISGFALGKAVTGVGGDPLSTVATGLAIVPQIQALRKKLMGDQLGDELFSLDPNALDAIKQSEQILKEIEESIKRIIDLEKEYERAATAVSISVEKTVQVNEEIETVEKKRLLKRDSINQAELERDFAQQRSAELKNQFVIGGRKDTQLLKSAQTFEVLARNAVPSAESKSEDDYYDEYQKEVAKNKALVKKQRIAEIANETAVLKNDFVISGRVDKNILTEIKLLEQELDRLNGKKEEIESPVSLKIKFAQNENLSKFSSKQPARDRDVVNAYGGTTPKVTNVKDLVSNAFDKIGEYINNALSAIPGGQIIKTILKIVGVDKLKAALSTAVKSAISGIDIDALLGNLVKSGTRVGEFLSKSVMGGVKLLPNIIKNIPALTVGLVGAFVSVKLAARAKAALQKEFEFEGSISGLSKTNRADVRSQSKDLERFGVDRQVVAKAQGNFSEVAKGLNLKENTFSKSTSDLLLGLTKQGLSSEAIDRVLTAKTQILDKGKVYTEEVQQLNESLPGSRGLVAKALNTTPDRLQSILDAGGVDVTQFTKDFDSQVVSRQRDIDPTKSPEISDKRLARVSDKFAIAASGNVVAVTTGLKNALADASEFGEGLVTTLAKVAGVGAVISGIGLGKFVFGLLQATGATTLLQKGLISAVRAVPQLLLLSTAFDTLGSAFNVFSGGDLSNQIKQIEELTKRTNELAAARELASKNSTPKSYGEQEGDIRNGGLGKILKGDIIGGLIDVQATDTSQTGEQIKRGSVFNYGKNGQIDTNQFKLTSSQLDAQQLGGKAFSQLEALQKGGVLTDAILLNSKLKKGEKLSEADQSRREEIQKELDDSFNTLSNIPESIRKEFPGLQTGIDELGKIGDVLSGRKVSVELAKSIAEFTDAIAMGVSKLSKTTATTELTTTKASITRVLSPGETAKQQLDSTGGEIIALAQNQQNLATARRKKLELSQLPAGERNKQLGEINQLETESIQNLTKIAQLEQQIADAARQAKLAKQDTNDQRKKNTIAQSKDREQQSIDEFKAANPDTPQASIELASVSVDKKDLGRRREDLARRSNQNKDNLATGTISTIDYQAKLDQLSLENQTLTTEQLALQSRERIANLNLARELKSIEVDLRKEIISSNEQLQQRLADLQGKKIELKFDVLSAVDKIKEVFTQLKLSGLDAFKSVAENTANITVKSFAAVRAQVIKLGAGNRDVNALGLGKFTNRQNKDNRENPAESEANLLTSIESKRIQLQIDLFKFKERSLLLELERQNELLKIEEKKARLANQSQLETAQLDKDLAVASGDSLGAVKADLRIKQALRDRDTLGDEFAIKGKQNAVGAQIKTAELASEGTQLSNQLSESIVKLSDKLVLLKPGRDPNSNFTEDYSYKRQNQLLEQTKKFDLTLPKFNYGLTPKADQSVSGIYQGAKDTSPREIKIEVSNTFNGANERDGEKVSRQIVDALKGYTSGLVN